MHDLQLQRVPHGASLGVLDNPARGRVNKQTRRVGVTGLDYTRAHEESGLAADLFPKSVSQQTQNNHLTRCVLPIVGISAHFLLPKLYLTAAPPETVPR